MKPYYSYQYFKYFSSISFLLFNNYFQVVALTLNCFWLAFWHTREIAILLGRIKYETTLCHKENEVNLPEISNCTVKTQIRSDFTCYCE